MNDVSEPFVGSGGCPGSISFGVEQTRHDI
jgi:hypothetical protein